MAWRSRRISTETEPNRIQVIRLASLGTAIHEIYVTDLHMLTSPLSLCVERMNVYTGPEFREQRRREALCHDIRILMCRGHMKNPDLAKRHLLSNKVDVDFDVLGSPMLDGVGCHVDGPDIVTENHGSSSQWVVKLAKELADPAAFGDGVSNSPVLRLRTRSGHRGLPLGGP